MQKISCFTVTIMVIGLVVFFQNANGQPARHADTAIIQFVFCSDLHFGLTKDDFRGSNQVPAAVVNRAMVEQINKLPSAILPKDGGINSGNRVKGIDAVVVTGDIANREEQGIQSATASWKEFVTTYVAGLQLRNSRKKPTPLLLTPGNHDRTNAIGYRRPMVPEKDAASLVGIYKFEIKQAEDGDSIFNPITQRVHYSVNLGSAHCVFVDCWPDSAERVWMEKDLAGIAPGKPVFLFTHSMPDVEARFFTNPNGDHGINDNDKFENLVTE